MAIGLVLQIDVLGYNLIGKRWYTKRSIAYRCNYRSTVTTGGHVADRGGMLNDTSSCATWQQGMGEVNLDDPIWENYLVT